MEVAGGVEGVDEVFFFRGEEVFVEGAEFFEKVDNFAEFLCVIAVDADTEGGEYFNAFTDAFSETDIA